MEDILVGLMLVLLRSIVTYNMMVSWMNTRLRATVSLKVAQYPRSRPFIAVIFNGLAHWAEHLVRHHTGVCAANPNLNVTRVFNSTTLLTHLLLFGFPYIAPALLPVYFLYGTAAFKVSFVAANLAISLFSQAAYSGYLNLSQNAAGLFAGVFECELDRALVTFNAAVAIAFQQLCIVALVWPVSTSGFVWAALASVAWR
jgi:hypothetical protein